MQFMNEYDIDFALRRFLPYGDIVGSPTPNRARAAVVVNNLADWANQNSDGWVYWQKPRRAAQRLVAAVASTTNRANEEQERVDLTDAELSAAIRPIKAFLTRQNVPATERDEILAPLSI
jgi:hypothetical protein